MGLEAVLVLLCATLCWSFYTSWYVDKSPASVMFCNGCEHRQPWTCHLYYFLYVDSYSAGCRSSLAYTVWWWNFRHSHLSLHSASIKPFIAPKGAERGKSVEFIQLLIPAWGRQLKATLGATKARHTVYSLTSGSQTKVWAVTAVCCAECRHQVLGKKMNACKQTKLVRKVNPLIAKSYRRVKWRQSVANIGVAVKFLLIIMDLLKVSHYFPLH